MSGRFSGSYSCSCSYTWTYTWTVTIVGLDPPHCPYETRRDMRALIQDTYGPITNLHLAEREKPSPNANQVLIRVRAAGVDPGIWHVMTGKPYMVRLMGFGWSKPSNPVAGWDASGVVDSTGTGVTR